MRRSLVGIALAAALALACREPVAPEPLGQRLSAWQPGDSATLIHDGFPCGLTSSSRMVIQDSTTWRSVWDSAVCTMLLQPPLPVVDFTSYDVLAAVSDDFDSWITIDSVVRFELGARVYVTECPVLDYTQSYSLTYHMVRTPRFDVESWRTYRLNRWCWTAA
jgi:hypothetical protein